MQWPLLASLSDVDRAEVLRVARPRSFAKGEVVCHEGDPADSMHLVSEGRLSVTVSLASGHQAMINLLGAGDYFGELALLRSDGRRTATITALEPARTLVLVETTFRRLCGANPALERALTQTLADQIDRLSRQVVELMYVGLDRRVYRRLLDLALGYGGEELETRGGGAIVVPFTQTQLADLTGGTRPSVNQALRRLVDDGTVTLGRGRITVHDVPGLRRRGGA